MLRALVLCLATLAPPAALAGAVQLSPSDAGASGPVSEQDWLQRFLDRIDGLDRPLFTVEGDAPACAPGTRGVTRALLIAAGRSVEVEQGWLDGPDNDVALIARSLALRGAKAENVVVLTGAEATWAGLAAAAEAFHGEVGCGDSVLLHLSGFAMGGGGIGLSAGGGPFDSVAKERMLSDLGGKGIAGGVADPILQAQPYAVLNYSAPGRGDVLSAAALSELVTLLRNRGADVSVSLDVASAATFDLQGRQANVDPVLYPRLSLPGACNGCDLPGLWTPTLLTAQAGQMTVFYSSQAGNAGVERRLPRGEPDARVYGMLSFALASAIAEADRTTIGALARFIESQGEFERLRRQDFTFLSTDADLDLIAEERPEGPIRDGRIIIDSPEITRAGLSLPKPDIEVRGHLAAGLEPINVTVNRERALLTPDGGFSGQVRLKAGVNRVKIVVTTSDNEVLRYDFELSFEGDIRAVIGEGKRYALIIGNQDYDEDYGITDLATPEGDARAVAEVLAGRYGFATRLVDEDGRETDLLLLNASQREIGRVIDRLTNRLGDRDQVLIFYAGHGLYEEVNGAAYWLPADAEKDAPSTYFHARILNDALTKMKARNVLVISDSCYSGMLLRGGEAPEAAPEEGRLKHLQRLAEQRSRVVISSGGNQPVADGGGDGHSVFARALLAALENPAAGEFSASELFQRVHGEVTSKADQDPVYRTIQGAGHDGGDFVFLASDG